LDAVGQWVEKEVRTKESMRIRAMTASHEGSPPAGDNDVIPMAKGRYEGVLP
jgi:hypothetical protein